MQIRENYDIKDILWYKIGGKVKYFLECKSKQDLIDAVNFIREQKIGKYLVVGLGANLLFTSDYFDGAVIYVTTEDEKQITLINETTTESYAGELIADVGEFAFEHSLIGLEWSGGLPGTVGAGVRGNVGAFGGEFKDSVTSADVIDVTTGELSILSNHDLTFSYRNSYVKQNKNLIVLSARFDLKKTSNEELEKAMQEYEDHIAYRNKNHPHEYPNSGSCFKNISEKDNVEKVIEIFPDMEMLVEQKWHGKVSVGYLNNKLGFSGFKVGDAQVSTKHGNFIDNLGNAKQQDVIDIIHTIQKKYQETFGFTPEPEVEIVK